MPHGMTESSDAGESSDAATKRPAYLFSNRAPPGLNPFKYWRWRIWHWRCPGHPSERHSWSWDAAHEKGYDRRCRFCGLED
jgi:hypothetical protein